MQLTRLAYASNHGGVTDDALEEIVLRCRANNERDGISSVLIASDEEFVQQLEGPRTAVARCFMRIMQDARHQHIRVLFAGAVEDRTCPGSPLLGIRTTKQDQGVLSRFWIDGSFEADEISGTDIAELCRSLSRQG